MKSYDFLASRDTPWYYDDQQQRALVFLTNNFTLTEADVFAFAGISGDFNPLHVSEKFAKNSIFKGRIAHGLLSAALIDYTLTDLVGLGGIHIS